jgi:hypothetical protein
MPLESLSILSELRGRMPETGYALNLLACRIWIFWRENGSQPKYLAHFRDFPQARHYAGGHHYFQFPIMMKGAQK